MMDEIQTQFNKVISYSQQGLENPQTDEIFERWCKAKERFYHLFGNKLIYEYPEEVSFHLTTEEKRTKFNDFIEELYVWDLRKGCQAFELREFLRLNYNSFYENKTCEEYKLNDDVIIHKNTKIVRSFKYFIKDKDVLNLLQSKASQVIQQDKVVGTLCLSIHPLDFLSASENTYNWRSCHALDGEYRAGNISYMLDESTVICYLKGEHEEKLPNFPDDVPWNSKKWRMWLFFSDQNGAMLFAGRQYPFILDGALDFIKNTVFKTIRGLESYNYPWCVEKIHDVSMGGMREFLYSPMIYDGRTLEAMSAIVKDAPNALHYNDLLYSHYYDPYYTYKTANYPWTDSKYIEASLNTPKVVLGHSFKCLRCGQEDAIYTESMLCKDCEIEYGECLNEDFSVCPWCGQRYLDDDGYYIEGENIDVCPDCFESVVRACDDCGEYYHEDSLSYDEEREMYLCESCRERIRN